MTLHFRSAGSFFRFVCILLAVVMATAPSASVVAQTNAAQQAVRQRVNSYGPYEAAPTESYLGPPPGDDAARYSGPGITRIDTSFISPSASAVLVIRPAQLLAAPIAEMLPKEVAAAAGIKYLGFDPAEVEEVVAFVDMSNPMALSYGATFKFANPFRASVIPVERRAHAQLAELAGKKYLQSSLPTMYSLFGPNNKTLVLAPDATLRQLVDSIGQPKTGPIIDRVQSVPAGSDLYMAVDVASLRPMIQMGMAQAAANVPDEAKPFLEMPNLIAAAELTVNISSAGPISLVAHANDEAAAQQVETIILDSLQKYQERGRAQFAAQAASDDPIQRAFAQYNERLSSHWVSRLTPQREGASLTLFKTEDASKQQVASIAVIGILVALLLPAIQAARAAAQRAQQLQPPDGSTDPGSDPNAIPQPPTERDSARPAPNH